MGTAPEQTYRYAGFISYAHADEAVAARLHKALETYPVPKYLRKQGKATSPVFRDVAELTAAHSLSEKIQEAVRGSRVLIVLCSPAAKASYWVNEEIRLFRGIHGDAAILSAIIEGTQETSFPEALTEGGREPLAAALSGDKAGFKLGVTQLAAGMLGTGLDDLVQRGAKRRQKIMGAGLAGSLALSGVMGFTALQAVEARNEAQSARGDAEGLVEYMIKDLKFKLEPVGRLDLLEGIGDKAVEYYDKQDIKSLPDDSLTRQAAARQVLAQVHLDAGRMEDAQREIEASAALTREVLERNPDDADTIFAHAQSEYWVGAYYFNQNKFDEALGPMQEYNRLGKILYESDPTNFDYIMEAAWGAKNLGSLHRAKLNQSAANISFDEAVRFFEMARNVKPNNKSVISELADTYSGLAYSHLAAGSIIDARKYKLNEINLLDEVVKQFPQNMNAKTELLVSKLDYNFDFFVEHDEEFIEQNKLNLSQLVEMVEFDNDNAQLKNTYMDFLLHIMTNVIGHSIQTDNSYSKFFEKLKFKSSNEREEFLARAYYIQKKVDKVIIDVLKYDLLAFNNFYQNSNSPKDLKILYILSHLNNQIGDETQMKVFAEKYLTIDATLDKTSYPTLALKRANILSLLGRCEDAMKISIRLKTQIPSHTNQIVLSNCLKP